MKNDTLEKKNEDLNNEAISATNGDKILQKDGNIPQGNEDNAEWREMVGEKTIITDSGDALGENRYAVWAYKDNQHHIVRVGSNKKKLQKLYRVEDSMIFTFNTDNLINQNMKEKKKPNWNRGSRENRDLSGRMSKGAARHHDRRTKL